MDTVRMKLAGLWADTIPRGNERYLTLSEIARLNKERGRVPSNVARLQALCQAGWFRDAINDNGEWLVPIDSHLTAGYPVARSTKALEVEGRGNRTKAIVDGSMVPAVQVDGALYLTADTVAKLLGRARGTVIGWARRGLYPTAILEPVVLVALADYPDMKSRSEQIAKTASERRPYQRGEGRNVYEGWLAGLQAGDSVTIPLGEEQRKRAVMLGLRREAKRRGLRLVAHKTKKHEVRLKVLAAE